MFNQNNDEPTCGEQLLARLAKGEHPEETDYVGICLMGAVTLCFLLSWLVAGFCKIFPTKCSDETDKKQTVSPCSQKYEHRLIKGD